MSNRFRVWFALAPALFLAPATAHAHLRLASSLPAQGDTVRTPLSEIRLTFTQAVEQRYTAVTLLDAFGREISMGTLAPVGATPSREYVLTLERPLMAGAFTVRWRTAGSDGHVVTGLFDFVVDAAPADTTAVAPHAHDPPGDDVGHAAPTAVPALYDPETSLAWIITRWLNFMALVMIVGAVAFRFGVLERARARLADEAFVIDLDTFVRRSALIAAVVALAANALRLWLQSGSLHGPARMWQPPLLSAMIFDTGWGKAWLAQTVAAGGVLVAVSIKTKDRLESWFSAAAFAVIAASTPAFSGHAAAVQQMAIVPILDDAVHVLTAAAWLGTLAVLVLAVVPRALRREHGFATTSILVHTFSPFALAMAGIAVFTGAMNALIHVGSITDLWTTSYGRVLALKIGVVLITLTIGAYNWRVVKPRLGTESVTAHFGKSARSELAMAIVIILITAVLVGTPTD